MCTQIIRRIGFALVAAFFLVLSSIVAPTQAAEEGNVFENEKFVANELVLSYGETGIISSHSTAIQFANVLEDSRCPKGTTCVWAGVVEVELLVWTGINPVPEVIQLRLDPTQPDAAVTKLSSNVGLMLRWVKPYPDDSPITLEKYVVGLEYELN